MRTKYILLFSSIVLMLISCELEGNEKKISSYNKTESHHEGKNCMICHVSGGEGEGWFNVAGTVYKANKTSVNPNRTIKLYTAAKGEGELRATIEVDGLGNFYTTNDIDFSGDLYPSIESDGVTQYMNSTVSFGECSSCHGVITDRLWAQ